MKGKVVHFEILGKDTEALQNFYGSIFEWDIDANNPINYGLVKDSGEGSIGGGIGKADGGVPPHATFYIEVENIQAHLDRITEMGGEVVMPETEIPNMVTFALFKDIEGNTVGLVKSGSH